MFNSQWLSFVHAQSSCASAIAVAFGSVFFAITGFAVDLILMDGYSSAV